MKKTIISLLIMVCFVGVVGCNESDNRESRERKSKITTKAEQTESIITESESQTTDLKSSEILDERVDDNGSKYIVSYSSDNNSIMIALFFETSEIEYNTNVIKTYLVNYLGLKTIDTLSVIATRKDDPVMLAQFIKENGKLTLDPVVGIIWSNDDYETEFNKSLATAETSDLQTEQVLIHEDEHVKISYLSIEKENIMFTVENKTNSELTFQSGTMALDGLSLGYVSGSDSIAPKSKGVIKFSPSETIQTSAPKKISGTIKVIDFSEELLEKSYEVKFVDIQIG